MEEGWFENLVTEALDSLPEEFTEKLKNVAVVVEDYPTVHQLRKLRLHPSTLLFGLYEGVPKPKEEIIPQYCPIKLLFLKMQSLGFREMKRMLRLKSGQP